MTEDKIKFKIVADWIITAKCPLRCEHCIIRTLIDNADVNKHLELTTTECKALIDLLHSKGSRVISFTGGEALMRSDIWKIFDYAKSKEMLINLYVTGLSFYSLENKRLRYRQIDKVLDRVSFLGISIDTFHDCAHKEISMKSYCEELVQKLFAYSLTKFPNVQIQLFTVLGRRNETSLDEIINECVYIGNLITQISKMLNQVIRWRISPFRYNASTMLEWQKKLLLNTDELTFIEKKLKDVFLENENFTMHFGVDYDSFFIYPDGKFVTVARDDIGEDKLINLGTFRNLNFQELTEWKRLYELDGNTAKLMERKDLLPFFVEKSL